MQQRLGSDDKKESNKKVKDRSFFIETSLMAMRQKNSDNAFIDTASEPYIGRSWPTIVKRFASPKRLLGRAFGEVPPLVLRKETH